MEGSDEELSDWEDFEEAEGAVGGQTGKKIRYKYIHEINRNNCE